MYNAQMQTGKLSGRARNSQNLADLKDVELVAATPGLHIRAVPVNAASNVHYKIAKSSLAKTKI